MNLSHRMRFEVDYCETARSRNIKNRVIIGSKPEKRRLNKNRKRPMVKKKKPAVPGIELGSTRLEGEDPIHCTT